MAHLKGKFKQALLRGLHKRLFACMLGSPPAPALWACLQEIERQLEPLLADSAAFQVQHGGLGQGRQRLVDGLHCDVCASCQCGLQCENLCCRCIPHRQPSMLSLCPTTLAPPLFPAEVDT